MQGSELRFGQPQVMRERRWVHYLQPLWTPSAGSLPVKARVGNCGCGGAVGAAERVCKQGVYGACVCRVCVCRLRVGPVCAGRVCAGCVWGLCLQGECGVFVWGLCVQGVCGSLCVQGVCMCPKRGDVCTRASVCQRAALVWPAKPQAQLSVPPPGQPQLPS